MDARAQRLLAGGSGADFDDAVADAHDAVWKGLDPKVLRPGATSPHREVRHAIAGMMSEIAEVAAALESDIPLLLDDDDVHVRIHAVEALRHRKLRPPTEVLGAALAHLTDVDGRVRWATCDLIRGLDPSRLNSLGEGDLDPEIREALDWYCSGPSVNEIRERLHSESVAARWTALLAAATSTSDRTDLLRVATESTDVDLAHIAANRLAFR